jgi:hypothetical protein
MDVFPECVFRKALVARLDCSPSKQSLGLPQLLGFLASMLATHGKQIQSLRFRCSVDSSLLMCCSLFLFGRNGGSILVHTTSFQASDIIGGSEIIGITQQSKEPLASNRLTTEEGNACLPAFLASEVLADGFALSASICLPPASAIVQRTAQPRSF